MLHQVSPNASPDNYNLALFYCRRSNFVSCKHLVTNLSHWSAGQCSVPARVSGGTIPSECRYQRRPPVTDVNEAGTGWALSRFDTCTACSLPASSSSLITCKDTPVEPPSISSKGHAMSCRPCSMQNDFGETLHKPVRRRFESSRAQPGSKRRTRIRTYSILISLLAHSSRLSRRRLLFDFRCACPCGEVQQRDSTDTEPLVQDTAKELARMLYMLSYTVSGRIICNQSHVPLG